MELDEIIIEEMRRERIRANHISKGKNQPYLFKKGHIISKKQRNRASLDMMGKKNHFFGKHHTEESIKLMANASKGNHHRRGKPCSKKTKNILRKNALIQFTNGMPKKTIEKIRKHTISMWKDEDFRKINIPKIRKLGLSMKGKKLSKETKIKIGLASLGRKASKKAKIKMSKAKIGKKNSPEHCKNIGLGRSKMKRYFIRKDIPCDKNFYLLEYVKNHRTMKDIAIQSACSETTIKNRLILFKIKRRKLIGDDNPAKRPENRIKISKGVKNLWKNQSYRENQIKVCIEASHDKPSGTERIMKQICKLNNLPFKYVGDGKLIIGKRNPDFIYKNKIVEINGEFWHKDKNSELRKRYNFISRGYKMINIWHKRLFQNPQRETTRLIKFLIE